MKNIIKYIIVFILFGISGLLLFDKMVLPIIVNQNSNIYLPDLRGLNYKIVEDKLDSMGFIPIIIYHEYSITKHEEC